MRIGFIGLDGLGGPMAARLAAAGHEVTGFRAGRTPPAGVSAAGSALEAAMGAEAVVLMQPDGPAARAAVSRILDSMAAGSILIDASTIDIADTRAIAA